MATKPQQRDFSGNRNLRFSFIKSLVALHERQENNRLLVRPDMTRGSEFLFSSNTNYVYRRQERDKPLAQNP